jgi:hypothetical protein
MFHISTRISISFFKTNDTNTFIYHKNNHNVRCIKQAKVGKWRLVCSFREVILRSPLANDPRRQLTFYKR